MLLYFTSMDEKKAYVVLGKVTDVAYCGSPSVVRRGSPHFLPNSDFIVDFFVASQISFDPKVFARGLHRSGLRKVKPLRFKFIQNLYILELSGLEPQQEKYYRKTGMIYDASDYESLCKLIDRFDHYQQEKITPADVVRNDDLFLRSKAFVKALKESFSESTLSEIVHNYLTDPISVKHRKKDKAQTISVQDFRSTYSDYFLNEVKNSVLNTDEELIFPLNNRMILGYLEIQILEQKYFKINRIHINDLDRTTEVNPVN